MSDDTQRAEHFERAYTEASAGRCWASGLSLAECKASICDCFDFPWVEGEAACPCGCPAVMHIGDIGCPCGMPDEPPCTPRALTMRPEEGVTYEWHNVWVERVPRPTSASEEKP